MIGVDFLIKPFSTLNECGDFIAKFDHDDYIFVAVGDVGGHGSENVGHIANECRELLKNNFENELESILLEINRLQSIKERGLTLFLSKIYKNTPIVEYVCVGNQKGYLQRFEKVTQLDFQEGVVGYVIPEHIKTHVLKLKYGDNIFVATDGVSDYRSALSAETTVSEILSQKSKSDDDAILVKISFNIKDTHFSTIPNQFSDPEAQDSAQKKPSEIKIKESHKKPSIEIQKEKEPFVAKETPNKHKSLDQKSQKKDQASKVSVEKPKEFLKKDLSAFVFYTSLESKNCKVLKQNLFTFLDVLGVEKSSHVKIITVILEIMATSPSPLKIYMGENSFCVQYESNYELQEKVNYIFNKKSDVLEIEHTANIEDKKQTLDNLKKALKNGATLQEIEIENLKDDDEKKTHALQQSNKMAAMGEMIGAIAHQWRQPLNAIGSSIQNLEYDYEDGLVDKEFVDQFIEKNKKTVQFMSKTIDDFRNFFRIDKEKRTFLVRQMIESIVNMQSAQLSNHSIALKISGEDFSYKGLESELQQVVLNLISNAKDAILEKQIQNPEINIYLQDNRIIVKDNAGGIPKEIINRVFEPYFTTKDQGKGTGMGLYMSKMIVDENLEGFLSVDNDHLGAVFTIDLKSRGGV